MKLERAKGFEPSAQNSELVDSQALPQSEKSDYTQIRAQILDSSSPDLAKVVEAWPNLPGPLKAAILAIIDSSAASKEDNR
jgi:hypothetical protein